MKIRVVNDIARTGCFGEPTFWSVIADRLDAEIVEFADVCATNWNEFKAKAWKLPPVDVVIQNATWAPPYAGGNAPYVAILQDNIRRMYQDPVPQHPTLSEARIIVANGKLIAEDYADEVIDRPERMRQIPIAIDVGFWTPDGTLAERQCASKPGVVFVGDGSYHKGFEWVANLAQHRRDLQWTFVMKGEPAAASGLGAVLYRVPRETVRMALRQSAVFVLASPVETECLAALEAMACDLPVVMPSTGAFYEWRPHAYHETSVPRDLASFNAALSRALNFAGSPRAELLADLRFSSIDYMAEQWRRVCEDAICA